MYEISPAWNEYYRELEPERREQINSELSCQCQQYTGVHCIGLTDRALHPALD